MAADDCDRIDDLPQYAALALLGTLERLTPTGTSNTQ